MNKEAALFDWYDMILKSWTWNKLSFEEIKRFQECINTATNNGIIKGDYRSRWDILNGLYHAFLVGIGYKPINWRDDPDEEIPFF